MRVLVTNDDGVCSEGLRQLALLAREAGHDVVVAAPSGNSSGSSASLTAVRVDGRVRVEPRHLQDLDEVPVFEVEAAPAFITLIATRGAFGGAPELVLSGVNAGHNAGQAVLHSGTVGAALTAGSHGCRAMAVSLAVGDAPRWESAIELARRVLPALAAAPARTVLNLNVPNRPSDEICGLRHAALATFGTVQTSVTEVGEGFVQLGVIDDKAQMEVGTDAALLAQGWATLTGLEPICEARAEPVDTVVASVTTS